MEKSTSDDESKESRTSSSCSLCKKYVWKEETTYSWGGSKVCSNCLEESVFRNFSLNLRKSWKGNIPSTNLLINFTMNDMNSICLLDLLTRFILKGNNSKKHQRIFSKITATYLHIHESTIDLNNGCCSEVTNLALHYNYPFNHFRCENLFHIIPKDIIHILTCIENTYIEQANFSLIDLTSSKNWYNISKLLFRRSLAHIASVEEFSHVLFSHSVNDLASSTITDLIYGRPASLVTGPNLCHIFFETPLLHPLIHLLKSQLYDYYQIRALDITEQNISETVNKPLEEKLTETFVSTLQKVSKSSCSSIVRLAEKLYCIDTTTISSNNNKGTDIEQHEKRQCALCGLAEPSISDVFYIFLISNSIPLCAFCKQLFIQDTTS